MEAQGMESMAPAMFVNWLPMIIFGCLYIVLIVAFIWGFFSMVSSQKRVAAAQEETVRILREIAAGIGMRSGGG